MPFDPNQHPAASEDRHPAGSGASPSVSRRRAAGVDWEADARAQIMALLGSDDTPADEAPADEAPAEETPAPTASRAGHGEAWLDKARRRVASLFHDEDDVPAGTPPAAPAAPAAERAAEFEVDWVVGRPADEEADAEADAEAVTDEPAPAPAEEPRTSPDEPPTAADAGPADAGPADAAPAEGKGLSRRELDELAELLNDDIVLEALEAGTLPLPLVVEAVRHHRRAPEVALWRHTLAIEGVDRDDLFARAARRAGFEAADVTDDQPSSTFLHTVLGVYPPQARRHLIELDLLPFAFDADAASGRQGFLIATHDPTHADVQARIPDLDPVVTLFYAPEGIVRRRVAEMREMEAAFQWVDDDDAEADAAPVTPQHAAAPSDVPTDAADERTPEQRAVLAQADNDLPPAPGAETSPADAEAMPAPTHTASPSEGAAEAKTDAADEAEVTVAEADAPTDAAAIPVAPRHAAAPSDAAEAEADLIDAVAEADAEVVSEADLTEAADEVAAGRVESRVEAMAAVGAGGAPPPVRPTPADVGPGEGYDLSPRTDGLPAPEARAALVADASLLDARAVAAEAEARPTPVSGDGYGDLALEEAQRGEQVGDDFLDLPDEPPLPPDVSWDEAAVTGQQIDADALAVKDRVVALLLHKEVVTADQVQRALDRREGEGLKETLWRVLAGVDGVDRDAVFREAATLYAFPALPEEDEGPDPDFARNVMNTFGEKERDRLIELRVLPYELDVDDQNGSVRLVFITHDPMRPEVHGLMKTLHLERFELLYAAEATVARALAEAFPKKNEYLERIDERGAAMDLGAVIQDEEELIDDEALEAEISRSTLINLFEASLVEAVRRGASDLHIYPNANKQVEIHFRVDGRLAHWHTEEKVHPEAMLAVIKDNSTNVDRFERDAAQDGFIQRWIDDALIRFRVSVLPIANASQELRSESIVIRVLDDRKVITDLGKLGLLKGALERFDHAIRQPHGMVILTGPTGSGKSTTLVASLHQVVTPEVNVLTVEDPVEYIIPGVRQIKLNHKLDLGGALRAILRHDPDVVMVGEMRDRKTAELAIKLANTGHLTFSTLHTNDAPSAISRLYKMGIEPFLIAYAINLVVAQRLIRTLCPTCKREDPDPDPVMLQQLGFSEEDIAEGTFYVEGREAKCPTCRGQGYKGRRAIAEALPFTRPVRHMIVEADGMIDESKIRDLAEEEGMLSLSASAREVVKMGETSAREMMRVVSTGE